MEKIKQELMLLISYIISYMSSFKSRKLLRKAGVKKGVLIISVYNDYAGTYLSVNNKAFIDMLHMANTFGENVFISIDVLKKDGKMYSNKMSVDLFFVLLEQNNYKLNTLMTNLIKDALKNEKKHI